MAAQRKINILIEGFYSKLDNLKDLISRETGFVSVSNKIKVAIGVRHGGKTSLAYEHILHLLNQGVERTQVLYINCEDYRLYPVDQKQFAKLVEAFYSLYPENHEKQCYLFFDEIQNIDGWSQVIRRLYDTKKVEIYLMGSGANNLNKKIPESIAGRTLSTEFWPYSFKEYITAKKVEVDLTVYDDKARDYLIKTFQEYLTTGGFPEVTHYPPDIRQQTLQEYVDIVIYRDIIERHKINNPSLIKHMIISMVHNVGRPFSINKFYNESKTRGYSTSKDVLYDYADFIEDAYLAFSIPLYDSSIRKVQTNPKKLYAVDTGLIRALTLDYDSDLGRLFENIVFLDLRRARCQVSYYLTEDRKEIDFIVQTPHGHKKFFQVVWDMTDEKTFERESQALEAGMKELNIPGEILTLDSYLQKGIILPS